MRDDIWAKRCFSFGVIEVNSEATEAGFDMEVLSKVKNIHCGIVATATVPCN